MIIARIIKRPPLRSLFSAPPPPQAFMVHHGDQLWHPIWVSYVGNFVSLQKVSPKSSSGIESVNTSYENSPSQKETLKCKLIAICSLSLSLPPYSFPRFGFSHIIFGFCFISIQRFWLPYGAVSNLFQRSIDSCHLPSIEGQEENSDIIFGVTW